MLSLMLSFFMHCCSFHVVALLTLSVLSCCCSSHVATIGIAPFIVQLSHYSFHVVAFAPLFLCYIYALLLSCYSCVLLFSCTTPLSMLLLLQSFSRAIIVRCSSQITTPFFMSLLLFYHSFHIALFTLLFFSCCRSLHIILFTLWRISNTC
jgi:hypothetical protein